VQADFRALIGLKLEYFFQLARFAHRPKLHLTKQGSFFIYLNYIVMMKTLCIIGPNIIYYSLYTIFMLAPVISLNKLKKIRGKLHNVVFVGGAFDILHYGHISHLKLAKQKGDVVIVQIVGNKRVREKKGPGKPILDEKERAKTIAALRFVDYVFIFNGRHYDQKVIDIVKPDILLFNKENFSPATREAAKALKNFNGKIVIDNQKKINSSSKIIKYIQELQPLYAPHKKDHDTGRVAI
jgi:rfaE bifunctional protein nucleotidyltransferase chain/domain